jgi:hypothetical protein
MSFERDQIETAWEHGRTMPEADPSVWREDACGAWIRRDQFGRESSEVGWKIENIAGGGQARLRFCARSTAATVSMRPTAGRTAQSGRTAPAFPPASSQGRRATAPSRRAREAIENLQRNE